MPLLGEKIRVAFSSMFFREHASSKMIVVCLLSNCGSGRNSGRSRSKGSNDTSNHSDSSSSDNIGPKSAYDRIFSGIK